MKKGLKRIMLAFVMVLALVMNVTQVGATVTEGITETVEINKALSYTGVSTPGYTFDSSQLAQKGIVESVTFDITINLPIEGDVSWNDWCGEVLALRVGDAVTYYDFGGAQVNWGVDMDGDENPDTTGLNGDSWLGSVADGKVTIKVPVNAETFTIDLYDNCWDTALEIDHYTINTATVQYVEGTIAATEEVATEVTATDTAPAVPAFDASGTYHAFLGVQSESYIFRNGWSDTAYGANGDTWSKQSIGDNFNGLTGWDGATAVVYDGVFTDTEIKGNGTYKVSLEDFDFGNDMAFNLLFVSTDIPMAGNPLTFTDVKVLLNDSAKYTFDKAIVAGIDTKDEKDYYEFHCINIWNTELLGGQEGLFGTTIPGNSVAVEFTVSGFDYDKVEEVVEEVAEEVVEEVAEATEAPTEAVDDAAEGASKEVTTDEATTDKPNYGLIIGIVAAVILVAGIVVVVLKKNKK